MKKRVIVILMVLPLGACIQLKSPENLVSDTYRTGKETHKGSRLVYDVGETETIYCKIKTVIRKL